MNTDLLRSKIVAKGWNIGQFCQVAGFNRATFDRKLAGRSEFDRDEIMRIADVLGLTADEVMEIFFVKLVA